LTKQSRPQCGHRTLEIRPRTIASAAIFYFEPFDESVEVYEASFTLSQEVANPMTREIAGLAAELNSTLAIEDMLEYQACDDAICYKPVELPVAWIFDWCQLVRWPGDLRCVARHRVEHLVLGDSPVLVSDGHR
jgi:hypothetical protein